MKRTVIAVVAIMQIAAAGINLRTWMNLEAREDMLDAYDAVLTSKEAFLEARESAFIVTKVRCDGPR